MAKYLPDLHDCCSQDPVQSLIVGKWIVSLRQQVAKSRFHHYCCYFDLVPEPKNKLVLMNRNHHEIKKKIQTSSSCAELSTMIFKDARKLVLSDKLPECDDDEIVLGSDGKVIRPLLL